ncbi:DUF2057 domain-containing protein [Vibrio sp. RM-69-4]|uniref:YccT family protein n=1 Tax=Vibrio sp. RM-69-4 TaxID=2950157 RepID=UPI00215C0CDC|nr:DUF2057 domain-containing protein [Vibrio sp. RM-69-4]MCR9421480.1 DUF2057 domain-containing protein [Vibrio sp. RM-69-4]
MMKIWLKALMLSAIVVPFSSLAKVEVRLSDDVNILAVNGEEIGFRVNKLSKLELDNGVNQLVVRVAKLVSKYGEFEKFNSHPVVITFEAEDQTLDIGIEETVNTVVQAEAFNQKPIFIIRSSKNIEYKQDKLPRLDGITRDYNKEIIMYNRQNNIKLATDASIADANVDFQNEIKSKPVEMVQYWFAEADVNDRKIFENWAFSNRDNISQPLTAENKPLDMLGYWYEKANKAEKSQILSWLLNQ